MNEEMLEASGYFTECARWDAVTSQENYDYERRQASLKKYLYGEWKAEQEGIKNVGRHQADSDNNTDNFVIF